MNASQIENAIALRACRARAESKTNRIAINREDDRLMFVLNVDRSALERKFKLNIVIDKTAPSLESVLEAWANCEPGWVST